jgi:hypothetical protein
MDSEIKIKMRYDEISVLINGYFYNHPELIGKSCTELTEEQNLLRMLNKKVPHIDMLKRKEVKDEWLRQLEQYKSA